MPSKQPIELVDQVVTEDTIRVTSKATVWISEERIDISPLAARDEYQRLMQEAKAAGAKIVYKNKTKSRIDELIDPTRRAYEVYNTTFDILAQLWKEKLAKGLFTGTASDPEMQVIENYHSLLQSFYDPKEPLAQLRKLRESLRDARNSLRNANSDDDSSFQAKLKIIV